MPKKKKFHPTYEIDISNRILSHPLKINGQYSQNLQGIHLKVNFAHGKYAYGTTPPLNENLHQMFLDFQSMLQQFFTLEPFPSITFNALMTDPNFAMPVNMAITDALSQKQGQPFSYLIDPNFQPFTQVPVIGLLPRALLPIFTQELLKTCNVGHPALKLKVGDPDAPDLGVAEDILRIQEVRKHSSDTPLSLDANGAYTPETAQSILEKFEPFSIQYIEEPVSGIAEMDELSKTSPIEIAVDESVKTIADLNILHSTDITTVVIKPTRFGDLSEVFQQVLRLQESAKRIVISANLDGPYGLAAAVQFASIVPGADVNPSGFDVDKLYTTQSIESFPIQDGRMLLPQQPGLGIQS